MRLLREAESFIFPEYEVTRGIDGLVHVKHVAFIGEIIAQVECPKKLNDVILACYLHDIGRKETDNLNHGLRGVQKARIILERHFPETDIEKILKTIEFHSKGLTSTDPIIGSVWDADRLNLIRFNIDPNPRLLSTETAKVLIPLFL